MYLLILAYARKRKRRLPMSVAVELLLHQSLFLDSSQGTRPGSMQLRMNLGTVFVQVKFQSSAIVSRAL
jgi:hypothetical protein